MESSTNNVPTECSWCGHKTKVKKSELNGYSCNKCEKKTTQLECTKCNHLFIEVYSKIGNPYKCANCNETVIPKVWESEEEIVTSTSNKMDVSTKIFLLVWIFYMLYGAFIILS